MSSIRFTRSNSLDSCEAMFVGLPSPQTETSSSVLRRISLFVTKIFTTRSRIRYELSKLDDSRYLEIYRLLGYDVLNQANECLLSQTQDEMLDEVANAIGQCSFQVQYEIFQVLRISFPWRRLLMIITSITLATMLSFLVWRHGGRQFFSNTTAIDLCMSTGLSAEVNCTMQHQSVHLELTAETKNVTTSAFPCQRSRYDSLLSRGQSKDQPCEVTSYEYIHASQEHPPEIHHYECQGNYCDHNIAVVHNNLYDIQFINDMKIRGVKVEPMPGCGELQIPPKVITELSSVEAIQLNFRKPELCKRLFCQVSSWGAPHLEYFGLDSAFIAIADIKCLFKILEAPTVTSISVRNTVLCHRCSHLLEQLDPRKFEVIHLLWKNYNDEHVQRSSKDFVANATTLKELRWNIPITEVELVHFMDDYEELIVGEFTINIEPVQYETSFNLSTTASSQIQELYLWFNVVNNVDSERVLISLSGFDFAGSKLQRIHLYVDYPNQFIISWNETGVDSWDIEHIARDGVIECLCTNTEDLNESSGIIVD